MGAQRPSSGLGQRVAWSPVTETEWLNSTDPVALLAHLDQLRPPGRKRKRSQRKPRRLAVEFWRWQADNLNDELTQKGLKDPNKLKSLWSINPTFGGPLKQDRLWFFAGFGYNRVDQYVAGLYLTKDPTAWGYVPDPTRPRSSS